MMIMMMMKTGTMIMLGESGFERAGKYFIYGNHNVPI